MVWSQGGGEGGVMTLHPWGGEGGEGGVMTLHPRGEGGGVMVWSQGGCYGLVPGGEVL